MKSNQGKIVPFQNFSQNGENIMEYVKNNANK